MLNLKPQNGFPLSSIFPKVGERPKAHFKPCVLIIFSHARNLWRMVKALGNNAKGGRYAFNQVYPQSGASGLFISNDQPAETEAEEKRHSPLRPSCEVRQRRAGNHSLLLRLFQMARGDDAIRIQSDFNAIGTQRL